MKNFAKLAFGAALVAGAAMIAGPASAAVSVGIGLGGPAYYPRPYYNYSCDPYSRFYDPYRCDYGYYGAPYYGPAYYGPSLVIGGRFGGGGGFRSGGGFRGGSSFHGGGSRSGGGGHHR